MKGDMLQMLAALDLDEPGLEWVRDSLQTTGRPLAVQVLDAVNLHAGSTLALGVRGGADINDRDQLGHAASASGAHVDVQASGIALLDLLVNLRANDLASVLAVESDVRNPEDHSVSAIPHAETIITDRSVYYARDAYGVRTAEDLNFFLGASSGYFLNCFIFESVSMSNLPAILQSQELAELVHHMTAIVNYVFDCDGYSIWLPSQVSAKLSTAMGKP